MFLILDIYRIQALKCGHILFQGLKDSSITITHLLFLFPFWFSPYLSRYSFRISTHMSLSYISNGFFYFIFVNNAFFSSCEFFSSEILSLPLLGPFFIPEGSFLLQSSTGYFQLWKILFLWTSQHGQILSFGHHLLRNEPYFRLLYKYSLPVRAASFWQESSVYEEICFPKKFSLKKMKKIIICSTWR